jgi:hypothetical protein
VPPASAAISGRDLDFVVLTSESYDSLNQILQALVAEIQKSQDPESVTPTSR